MIDSTKTDAPLTRKPPARKGFSKLKLSALALLFILLGAAWYYSQAHRGADHVANPGSSAEARSSSAQSAAPPITVETVRLKQGGITRTSAQIGTVHPFEEADLFAKISGYLSNLHVDYGDHVKHGQLLVEIDDPEVIQDAKKAEADVAQAKAAVAQSEAFLESAKADRDAVAGAVEQAVAEIDRYKSMRSYHEKKFARYRELVESKAIPQQIADEEEEGYESAKASELAAQKAVLKVKADLLAATARIKKAEADLTEAKANVDVAAAKLDRANVFVGYTRITSPYDGVITKRNFFRGAFIRSASEGGLVPLLTVARTDKVRVVTQVPDRDVPLTSVGDAAEVTLDALGSEVFRGKVSRFAETEDPTSRTMHTEIDLENPKDKIRPGMYGIAKILLDTPVVSTTLPASCLVGESKDGRAEVYVVRDGRAKRVKITTGIDDGLRFEVLHGLSPSDEVIVNTGSVTEGVPVQKAEHASLTTNTAAEKSDSKVRAGEHRPSKTPPPHD